MYEARQINASVKHILKSKKVVDENSTKKNS